MDLQKIKVQGKRYMTRICSTVLKFSLFQKDLVTEVRLRHEIGRVMPIRLPSSRPRRVLLTRNLRLGSGKG